jgi:uncharacterized membrane protein
MRSIRPRIFITACLLAMAPVAAAQSVKETVEADVSTRSVAITSSFVGTEILIFGTVENSRAPSAEAGTYDVVVVVKPISLVFGSTTGRYASLRFQAITPLPRHARLRKLQKKTFAMPCRLASLMCAWCRRAA